MDVAVRRPGKGREQERKLEGEIRAKSQLIIRRRADTVSNKLP